MSANDQHIRKHSQKGGGTRSYRKEFISGIRRLYLKTTLPEETYSVKNTNVSLESELKIARRELHLIKRRNKELTKENQNMKWEIYRLQFELRRKKNIRQ